MSEKSKEVRRIHLGLVLAGVICIPAFVFELSRALSGNELSWAYVFEWPLLGGYAIHMWHQILSEVRAEGKDLGAAPNTPCADPELDAWNEYLAKRHSAD